MVRDHLPQGNWIGIAAAAVGGLGVLIGAFGAHGLPQWLGEHGVTDPELLAKRLDQFDVGVRYQLTHAIALFALWSGSSRIRSTWRNATAICWLLGIGLFSAMLYALVAMNKPILGAIVPIGGVLMIVGWVALGIGIYVGPGSSSEIQE